VRRGFTFDVFRSSLVVYNFDIEVNLTCKISLTLLFVLKPHRSLLTPSTTIVRPVSNRRLFVQVGDPLFDVFRSSFVCHFSIPD